MTTNSTPDLLYILSGSEEQEIFDNLRNVENLTSPHFKDRRAFFVGSRGDAAKGEAALPKEINLCLEKDIIENSANVIAFSVEALLEFEACGFKWKSCALMASSEATQKTLGDLSEAALAAISSSSVSIIVTTQEDASIWVDLIGRDVALQRPRLNSESDNHGRSPLIEKTGAPRILLDAEFSVDNLSLIEPFISLENVTSEVWCISPARLKSWMKPDMLYTAIPEEEWGLYFRSVDIIVFCEWGKSSEAKVMEALRSGVVPLFSFDVDTAFASEVIDALGLGSCPKGFSAQIEGLLNDPAKLSILAMKARELASSYDAIDSRNQAECLRNIFCEDGEHKTFNRLTKNVVSAYLDKKYGNPEGCERHISFAKLVRFSDCIKVSCEKSQIGEMSGWVFDNASGAATDIVVVDAFGVVPSFTRYSERPDVCRSFPDSKTQILGFNVSFLNKVESTDDSIEQQKLGIFPIAISRVTNKGLPLIGKGKLAGIDPIEMLSQIETNDGEIASYDPKSVFGHVDKVSFLDGVIVELKAEIFTNAEVVFRLDDQCAYLRGSSVRSFWRLSVDDSEQLVEVMLKVDEVGNVLIRRNSFDGLADCGKVAIWLECAAMDSLTVYYA